MPRPANEYTNNQFMVDVDIYQNDREEDPQRFEKKSANFLKRKALHKM